MADSSVFHPGEQEAQTRAGIRERIEQVGRILLRDHMPDQHRELFAQLPMLVVGSLDGHGRPWASILAGRPGFVGSPDPRTLRVDARPFPGDPLAANLAVGAPLGILGIELPTRRRNRLNGRVVALDARGFSVAVEQSFGNCPKYIQARTPTWLDREAPPPAATEGATLSADARRMISYADTFFIASAAAHAASPGAARAEGVDVSHRGGKPGFVRIAEVPGDGRAAAATELTVPDFVGNYLFNTLGNLIANPRAGLVFVDFERGDLLSLTGAVTIVWDGPEVAAFAGAERLLRIRVDEGWHARSVLPLCWSTSELSPHLQGTGP
ncbi:MAG TPA: pyridoxamine 5'-phosphate oxidase family protein [Candidatus Binatia bacterium]